MNLRNLLYGSSNLGTILNTVKTMLGSKSPDGSTALNQQDAVKAISELSLLFETMYNLMVSKGIFTNEEFQKKFEELDMLDGVKDGQHKK
ncbi:MAG TPA: hypothetical protein PLE45_12645 [Spirochaetota bacterium]|nr:hypothetical protein [Spirochaetota bacterium]HOL58184.1 hypothetical protein [Spirochaetota bacterium]HPP05628.1 hypothetical protein [Spirochaetota bacterium]